MEFSNIISKNKSKLVRATNCNDALLDKLAEEDILHDAEVSDLRAEKSDYSRASYLWDRLKQKSVTKEALIKIFEDLYQGVASLLTTLLLENSVGQNESKPEKIPKKVQEKTVEQRDNADCDGVPSLSDDDLDFMKNEEPFNVQVVYPQKEVNYSDDYYKLSRDHKGYALVINITKFEDSSKNRSKAEIDTTYMVKLFSQLGFTVDYTDVNETFTEENIMPKVVKMKAKFEGDTSAKCLIVYLGSHGKNGKVMMSNGVLIDPFTQFAYEFIFNDLENNGKRKIAKLFFLSACELSPLSSTCSTMDASGVRPNIQDAMFSLSTSPGYPSVGDKYLGTHYVNLLTKIFMKYSYCCDLNTMLDLIEDFFRKIKKSDKELQHPIHYGVLMKKLYFNLPVIKK